MEILMFLMGCILLLAVINGLFLLYMLFEKNNRTTRGVVLGSIFIAALVICGAQVLPLFFWKAFHPDASALEYLESNGYKTSLVYGAAIIIASQVIYQTVKYRVKKSEEWPPRFLVFK